MNDQTVEYFLGQRMISKEDAAEVSWSHAVNSRSLLKEALAGNNQATSTKQVVSGGDIENVEPLTFTVPSLKTDEHLFANFSPLSI